jgi:hypothetical protein
MRTGKQTDMTKLIIAFCNFSKAPKNGGTGVVRKVGTNVLNTRRHKPQDRNLNSYGSHNLNLTKGI